MTSCEKKSLHDALIGAGNILVNIVDWFEQVLGDLTDSEGDKIEFSRCGEYGNPSASGSLSWQTENQIAGSSGWFRLRSDFILHPRRATDEIAEPFIVWQVFASSSKVAKNLDILPIYQ